jgi:branched-chain amino acid aminotransferase
MNGTLLADADARVSVFDHGLTVGDGVFETVKISGGVPFALTRHLARLRASAAGLDLPELDLGQLRAGVSALLDAVGRPGRARMRITVTGGSSPLGSVRGDAPATVIVALGEWLVIDAACDVVSVPWPRNERGALAGLKTTSYAENVLALGYARDRGGSEAIFANTVGNLCEGTGTSVFVVSGARLLTPPLSSGCLAGVTRGLVLEWTDAIEEDLPAGDLGAVAEAFLTSTTRDVQPIRAVNGQPLPAAPGPVTRRAAEIFAAMSAAQPDP